MALSLNDILRGSTCLAPIITMHGVHGIGKTTFAASAPDPVFILTEKGLGLLDVPHFPLVKSFEEIMDALSVLCTEQHDYKTLVIDSLDWLEPLIWQKVCRDHQQQSIEQFGYGKGYVMALDIWGEYIDAINYLRDAKGMTIIQIAHTDVKRYDDPTTEPYDRYIIKLHKGASAKIQEHSDVVLFANYKIGITQADVGMNKKKARAIGAGDRRLYAEERPAFLAKNRFSMPADMPLSWEEFASHIPFFNQTASQAAQ